MSFDVLAPHYRWMEWLLAGRKLQRCRTAFLRDIPAPRHALLLGEGNGRFLAEFLAAHPRTAVTCVDASAEMLASARMRLENRRIDLASVTFVCADVLAWSPPCERFDLIASHFFLDCFQPAQIGQIVATVSRSATRDAQWLLADFREPASGPARWRGQVILGSMYFFFRRVTGLSGSRITPPEAYLPAHGFALRKRLLSEWGLLHSDWWARGVGSRPANSVSILPEACSMDLAPEIL